MGCGLVLSSISSLWSVISSQAMSVSFRLGDADPSVTPTQSQLELEMRLLGTGHFSRAWARQRAALLWVEEKKGYWMQTQKYQNVVQRQIFRINKAHIHGGNSLRRFTCWSREQLPEFPVHIDQSTVDDRAQQVQAESFCLGWADPSQCQGPHPTPQPAQLRPVNLGPLRVVSLAAGHLPQTAQHVRPPLSPLLLG